MQTFAQSIARNDGYLFSKWEKLQALARVAHDEIAAIPETAPLGDEVDAITFAIAPLQRAAETFCMIEPTTAAGSAMKARAVVWLDGGALADLTQPVGEYDRGVEPVLN